MDLNTIWFILVGILIAGYALLDGFDLGVGVLSLFARNDAERRVHRNAIGPVWDGNEVWLLTAGGALFAAFPPVYATVFSGFYIAFMLLLAALIFRAVSLEFGSRVESASWRRFWDWSFGLGSLVPAILFGVAFGNILRGIPIDADGHFAGSFPGLLNPFALLIGALSLAMFVMHGAAYLAIKTEGELQERLRKWGIRAWGVFAVLYLGATLAAMLVSPFLFGGLMRKPLFYVVLAILAIALPMIPNAFSARRYGLAFLSTSAAIASMIGLSGLSLFPTLVPSRIHMAFGLTVYNASSTPKTLAVMLLIALIGMPLVIVYTAYVYHVFRGKVRADAEGYH